MPEPIKPRLLIVEDEAIVAADLAIRVSQMGCQVAEIAASGERAIFLAEALRPDLVLMDISLQGSLQGAMDGITAAMEMRTRFRLPVVFITAYGEGSTFRRAKEAEPYGYILKPFEDRELEIAIEMALYKHQAERKLRESEERHRTIIETAMDGFWLVDGQGHLLEVNQTYCTMCGYTMAELLTMQVADLEVNESPADTSAHIQQITARGEDRFESRHCRKDGSVFDVEVSVLFRSVEGGRMVAFMRDITERKRAEAEQAKQLDELRRWHAATLDREHRIGELKREVNALAVRLREEPPYGTPEQLEQLAHR